jgi:gamma-glutamylcyclotransferase (GGCT)/AIG2-like uncharacterized protein YtfP
MWPPWLWLDAYSARARQGPALLADHRLEFSKLSTIDGSAKANVASRRGSTVWGVLFDIDQRELRELNRKEGGYEPTAITVLDEKGAAVRAWTYVWAGAKTRKWPYRWYLDLIRRGAMHFDLPRPYRNGLARRRGKRNQNDDRARVAVAALTSDPDAPPPWPPS